MRGEICHIRRSGNGIEDRLLSDAVMIAEPPSHFIGPNVTNYRKRCGLLTLVNLGLLALAHAWIVIHPYRYGDNAIWRPGICRINN